MLDYQLILLIGKNILPGWMGLPLSLFCHVSPFYVIVLIRMHFECNQVHRMRLYA